MPAADIIKFPDVFDANGITFKEFEFITPRPKDFIVISRPGYMPAFGRVIVVGDIADEIEAQFELAGIVLNVQVIPSVDVAAEVELFSIATKTPLPKTTDTQDDAFGIVRSVQVMPSVEDAAEVALDAIATKVPLP